MNDDLLSEFLNEGRDLVAQAGEDLAALARTPTDLATLDSCFRAIHTLKGSTGLFDLTPMGRLLHAAEDQLGTMRQACLADKERLPALIAVIDQIDQWLDDLARAGALPADAPEACRRLMALLSGDASTSEPRAAANFGDVSIRYAPKADAYFSGDDPIAIIKAVPGLRDLKVSPREPFGDLSIYDPFTCNLLIEAVSSAGLAQVEAALRWVKDQVELSVSPPSVGSAEGGEVDAVARTVRVEATRVDRLADLADELVIAKNGLSGLAGEIEMLPGGHAAAQALRLQQARIDRLVADLHATVGKVRLTPLSPLFGRFPRLARDIARDLGKSVSFEVEGGDIEVDKAVVDGLFEPLLHVLRNALDHGVERADARRAAGKPENGRLLMAARTAGEQVIIEVRDDGAGMDPQRVRALAVQRGLVGEDAVGALDDQAVLDLIFLPGFSTAASVTDISGRGVGMDAVRKAVARLGGRVDLESRMGEGSTVRFLLPISMVLTKIMVVACGGELYGVALEDVIETTRVTADRIIPVRAGEAFQLRDRVVPLVRLDALVGSGATSGKAGAQRVVVARAGGETIGFAVDAIVERMDAAVRPMTGLLAGARGMAGSTLLANGAVLMVLDLQELVR